MRGYRRILGTFGLTAAVSLALGGCVSGGALDQLPESLGGEPAALPKRPATSYQYPAVHDMPPDRSTAPMSADQQYRLEQELKALRDRQAGAQDGGGNSAQAAKKKPVSPKTDQTSGAAAKP
jgi:hypothetical protein